MLITLTFCGFVCTQARPAGPSTLNQRYFPNKRDYSNIIRAVRVAHMHSLVDQEELKAKTGEWKELHPHDNFFFRPYVEQEETEDHCQEDDDDDADVQ